MKYILFLIPLILSMALTPAFAEITSTNEWTDNRGIDHIDTIFDCSNRGHGALNVVFFEDYVYITFQTDNNNGSTQQTYYDYSEYEEISKYYQEYIGVEKHLC